MMMMMMLMVMMVIMFIEINHIFPSIPPLSVIPCR